MCAIYAFMRYCDDLSDEPGATRAAIDAGAADMEEALAGPLRGPSGVAGVSPHGRALRHPARVFPRDDRRRARRTWSRGASRPSTSLYRYCYQVASVVGLTIIHIFGFDTRSALPLAEKCGVAFQLTNILRDIREDAERGRIYLPAEDLRRFGVTRRRSAHGQPRRRLSATDALRSGARTGLLQRIAAAAGSDSSAQPAVVVGADLDLLAAAGTHRSTNYDVFSRRVRLSLFEKSWIVVRALAS